MDLAFSHKEIIMSHNHENDDYEQASNLSASSSDTAEEDREIMGAIMDFENIKNIVCMINDKTVQQGIDSLLDTLERRTINLEAYSKIPNLSPAASKYIREHLNPFAASTAHEYDSVIALKAKLAMREIAKNTSSVFRRVKAVDMSSPGHVRSAIEASMAAVELLSFDMSDMAKAGVDILKELSFKRRAINFKDHFNDEQAELINSIGCQILERAAKATPNYLHENTYMPIEAYFED
jgi:hypothetical protein